MIHPHRSEPDEPLPPLLLAFILDYDWLDHPAAKRALLDKFCSEHVLDPALCESARLYHSGSGMANQLRPERRQPAAATSPDMPAIENLGDFVLEEEIASGGMGTVYRAMQKGLLRSVAVKIVRLDRPSLYAEKLRDESRNFANLHHTQILPVYAAGVGKYDGREIPYYAMQHVDGASLDCVIQNARVMATRRDGQPRTLKEVVQFVITRKFSAEEGEVKNAVKAHDAEGAPKRLQVSNAWVKSVAMCVKNLADAVSYIHDKGFIHRDLKPRNVMIDREGHPWVIDFGLASIPQGSGKSNPYATTDLEGKHREPQSSEPHLEGTPAYSAPEQFRGATDVRSDVWGLGMILYESLAFQRAYAYDWTDENKSWTPIANHSSKSNWGNSKWQLRPPDHFVDGVPDDFAAICRKALQPDPGSRYQTSANLAADLQRFLDDDDVSARRPSFNQSLRRLVRRHRVWAVALGLSFVLLLVVFASLIITKNSWAREKLHREVAEQRLERIRGFQNAYAVSLAGKSRDSGRVAHAMGLLDSLRPSPGLPDIRGSEWQYLVRACHEEQSKFQMKFGEARCVAASRTGNLIAYAGDDRHVYVASTQDREPKFVLDGHSVAVNALAFSPAGNQLASGDEEGVVCVWDLATGRRLQLIEAHILPITALAWSEDFRFLLTAGEDRMLRLWNAANGQPEKILTGHRDKVTDMDFSLDGKLLVTVQADKTVQVVNADDWSTVAIVKLEGSTQQCALTPRREEF